MTNNLAQIIFDQFLEIVKKHSKCACFDFDECSFDYKLRQEVKHRLLDVSFKWQDNCGRCHIVIATIDITNICLSDLTSCKWICYLEKIAQEFIYDICPKKFVVVKEKHKKCRPEPPCSGPFPCKITTVICKQLERKCPEPEIKIVEEVECDCPPCCERDICCPKEKVIIRKQKPGFKCGDFTHLVKKDKKGKFGSCKGFIDYNNHQWSKKSCCKPCRKTCASC